MATSSRLRFSFPPLRHSCGSRNPEENLKKITRWIPAFAGMTDWLGSFPYLAYVLSVHISPISTSPEGEGFPRSPMVTLDEFIKYLHASHDHFVGHGKGDTKMA
jgi:hypothetical protein